MSKSAWVGLYGQRETIHEKTSKYLGGLMLKSVQFSDVLLRGAQTGSSILIPFFGPWHVLLLM